MKSTRYHIIALLILALGCRDRFEGFDFQSHNAKLVIEAIVTDNDELGYVRITYTEPVEGNEIRDYVTEDAASVVIADDQGNEFTFFSQGEGLYANSNFSPAYGTNYRMMVQVGPNRYESDWQALPSASQPAIEVQYRPDTTQVLSEQGRPINQHGITLSDVVEKGNDDGLYHWQFNYYYIYDAYGQPDILAFLPDAIRFCYVQEHDQAQMVIHEDSFVEGQQNSQYRLDITSVPFGRKMIYDYSVQVIKYEVSESLFEYLQLVEQQINRVGGVFDAAPSNIESNFTQISGDLEVLGFFGVFNAAYQRLFFNQDELPFNKLFLPSDAISCPGDHNVDLSNVCFNCTAVEAPFNSPTKPSWWR